MIRFCFYLLSTFLWHCKKAAARTGDVVSLASYRVASILANSAVTTEAISLSTWSVQ